MKKFVVLTLITMTMALGACRTEVASYQPLKLGAPAPASDQAER